MAAIANFKISKGLVQKHRSKGSQERTTLFEKYKPRKGGQEAFWDTVPFGNRDRTIPLTSPYRSILVKGGIGSGKSNLGAAFACTRAYYDPGVRGLISANEYGQLEAGTLVALAEFCEEYHIPLEPKRESVEKTAIAIAEARLVRIFDAYAFVLSANKFQGATAKSSQGGRGTQVGWLWFDEGLYADRVAFETIAGRLGRDKGNLGYSLNAQGVITSSINRNHPKNWGWDLFDDPERSDGLKKLYTSVTCKTSDNDKLPSDYYESLKVTYILPELIAIELEGEYAQITVGRAFKEFRRDRDVRATEYNRLYPLIFSLDFNWNPATAIAAQFDGKTVKVLEEFYLLNSSTRELANTLKEYAESLHPSPPAIVLYGDASGSQRTAASQQSNWQIVHSILIGARPSYPRANPPIIDTVNACNQGFLTEKIAIAPGCKELIADLEFMRWVENPASKRKELDKRTDPLRSHLVDCLRYLTQGLLPIRAVKGKILVGKQISA